MRKTQKAYMFWMSETEKAFIDEMAWRQKMPMAKYLKKLIHKEMEKNPDAMKAIEQRKEA